MPRGSIPGFVPPGTGDFGDWSKVVVNIGTQVTEGTDIRLGFQEYYSNNWYDVRAIELDLIESDLWAEPMLTTTAVRANGQTIELDYYIFSGYPRGEMGVCWGPGPNPEISNPDRNEWFQSFTVITNQGAGTCVITNMATDVKWWLRPYVKHDRGVYYGNEVVVYPADSAGEGYLFESFETTPLGQMPPPGWSKWQEAGGRGWSNSWAGRMPLPGWLSGTNTVPPGGGERLAYATYTHGGAKTNDLWLISPTIENIPPNCELSFWFNSAFSNFADNLYVYVSEDTNAHRKADFNMEMQHLALPRGYVPGVASGDFGPWSNYVVRVTDYAATGANVRIAFREFYENNWYDVRANQLDLIEMGSKNVRYSLRFDGSDDYAMLDILQSSPAFTMEAWVQPLEIKAQTILTRTAGDPLSTYSELLAMDASGRFVFYTYDGAEKFVTGTTVAQVGRWYHVAGVAQHNGTMHLYVNGTEEGSALHVGTLQSGLNQVALGTPTAGGMYGHFDGLIDEVRLWSTTRSSVQIRDQMNVYLRGTEDHLVACYRLDSSWGTDLFDFSQSGFAESLTNVPAASQPLWTHASAPLASYAVAGGHHVRGIWETQPASLATNGLNIGAMPSGATNYLVFSDNNLTGSTETEVPTGHPSRRLARVWYIELTGLPSQTANLIFTPAHAGYPEMFDATATFNLLRRHEASGVFTDQGLLPSSVADGEIVFSNVMLTTGYYTLSRNATAAPDLLSATGTTAYAFFANWEPVPLATNYWADVATDADFTTLLPGYHNRPLGETTTLSVTGLLPAVTYTYRLRAESAGGISTNSATGSTTTLTEGAIGFSTNALHITATYGTNPAPILFALTNPGQTAYAFSLETLYDGTASGWLSIAAGSSSVAASADLVHTASVVVATMDTGMYFATNVVLSPTATNSPASLPITLTIEQANQTILFPAIDDKVTTNTVGLAATAASGLEVAFAVADGPATISGGTNLTFTGAGTVRIVAAQAGDANWLPAPGVTNTFTVSKALATVAFTNLVHTYDGTAKPATATTDPENLNVLLTYNGSTTAPTDAGSYAVTGTVDEVMYQGEAGDTLTINKANQTILFPAIDDKVTTDTVGLAATAASGLEVAFAVADGPATISDATNLTFTGAGTVRIVAAQAGDANWLPAPSVTNTFTVSKALATVAFTNLVHTYDGAAKPATATTDPENLNVVLTYNGSTTAPTDAGSYAVTGTVDEVMYQGEAGDTLTIDKAAALVYLVELNQAYDGFGKSVTATTDPAGLTVAFTYDGATNLPVDVGTYVVTGAVVEANWIGEGSGTLSIGAAAQSIDFPAIGDNVTTDAVGLAATASSGLEVAFAVADGPASISGGTNLTFTGAGTVHIIASQAGDTSWLPAPDVTNTFSVSKAAATVALTNLVHTYDGTAKSATAATDPEGLPVVLTYNGSAIAPTNAGSYTVAGMIDDVMYQGETVSTLTVHKATATVYLFDLVQTYDGLGKHVTATTGWFPKGLLIVLTYNGDTNLPVQAGEYAVTGTVVDVNWMGEASDILRIEQANQAIDFPAIPDQRIIDQLGLMATASSGLDVTFAVAAGPALLAEGTNLTFSGTGTVHVIASQAGDVNWQPAPTVTNTFRTPYLGEVKVTPLSGFSDPTNL
jgi:hypothetical protein